MHDAVTEPVREPARITIGTDPSGMPRRPDPKRRGGSPQRPPSAGATPPPSGDRNLPVAVASGLILAAVFLALTMWRPAGAVAFVTVALGLASIEYFSKVTEKGYRPAVAAGVAASVAAPLAAYWVGDSSLPLVITFAFLAGALGFIGANSIEVGPMPNMAITMLGVVWIGVMGSFAALILRWSTFGAGTPWGTDTLVLIAIGVVANDIGAYFVGSAFGRTPLRQWISPNKSIEGFLGGTILTLVVMLVIGMQDLSDTWSSTGHLLMLAIVISIMAPLGDLTESMFKRNLDVKDFGTIVRGSRRRARPLRRLPVHPAGGLLLDARDRTVGGLLTDPVPTRTMGSGREGRDVRVGIAGSTGSIGTQTLDVIRAENDRHPGAYEVVALGVGRSAHAVIEQALEFRPAVVVVTDPEARAVVADALPTTEVVADLADVVAVGRRGRQRRRRLRRSPGDDRDAPGGQASRARQQGEPDRRRPDRAAAALHARCRARTRRQRALCVAPVPAVLRRFRPTRSPAW